MQTETKVGIGCLAIGLSIAGYGMYKAINATGLQNPIPFVVVGAAGGFLITVGAMCFVRGA